MRTPTSLVSRRTALAAGAATLAAPLLSARGVVREDAIDVRLGPAEPLPGLLHGFNTYILPATAFQGMTYDGPQFEAAVRTLRPRAVRFPGGTIANNYLWREDSFSEPTSDKTGWAGEQLRLFRKLGKEFDLRGFARICKRYDLEPVWVLNVYEETPEGVSALFDRLDELGLSVTRVEFGNEPYWDGRSLMNVWDYLKVCRPVAAAVKRARPGVKIGACFGPTGEPYRDGWNATLGEEDWFDAAVFHDYYGGQGFALEPGDALPAEAMLRPEALVDDAVAALDVAAPGKPIWLTEWNVGSDGLERWKNTGAELLFLAATFARLIDRRDRIPLACFHNIYEQRFGTFWLDEESGAVRTNASWELFRLLGVAFADATELRPMSLGGETDADLVGFAAAAGGDVRLFLVNRGSDAQPVTLPTQSPDAVGRLTIVCPPETRLATDAPLATRSAVTCGTTTLPAYSISVIAAPAALAARPPQVAGGENLFPRRPDLEFWHPPHAATQPRFDVDGVYAVDLSGLRTREIAVLKMNLAGLNLTAGAEYAVRFEAKSDPAGGVVVKLPAAGDEGAGTTFLTLGGAFVPQRLGFAFDPAANGGEVSFVFPPDRLGAGGTVSFRAFSIGPAE